jgi:hypothetical protein
MKGIEFAFLAAGAVAGALTRKMNGYLASPGGNFNLLIL